MAILSECPICHKKQSIKNRLCSCGENLMNAKRAQRVRYWISYRLPGGKQKREAIGYSIEEARDAEGKRRSQKRENRIFDIKPYAKMTFRELAEWYLGLEKVKAKAYYETLRINLNSFNSKFGAIVVNQIKPIDLENYQAKRKKAGYSDSYVDQEIGAARTMINKAFDNDLVGGDTLRAFKKVKKLLKRNANARDKILDLEQFNRLMDCLPRHTKRFEKDGFVFHDLRHMFNTYMRKAGVAESVIMKITGHSTREMFDRYNSVDEEDIKGAVDQMQVFLKSVDQNVDQEKEKILPGQG